MSKELDLMSAGEVGRMFGVSSTLVWQWMKAGKLEGQKVGHTWLYRRADVERWERERAKRAETLKNRPLTSHRAAE